MIAISEAEFSRVKDLATTSLLRYLRGRGWSPSRNYGRGQLWELPVTGDSGEPYEVLVPLDRTPRDYADRVADLVETLSVVEARSPADVLREMSLPSADWQFLRLTPPGPAGTVPLTEVVPALAGLKDLMTSAAAAEASPEPQPVQPAQKPQLVKDHVATVRLDQTRVGSYVVAVHTPLPELPSQGYLFDDDTRSEPFARRVSRRLYAALVCAREAAETSLRDDAVADFAPYVPGGLSANLCEALVRIGGDEGPGFSLDFTWSSDLPMERPTERIRLARPQLTALDAGAKDLRARLGNRDMTLRGSVVRLHRELPHGPGAVTVAGSFEDRDRGRLRRVRMTLDQHEYSKAAEAHRRGDEVLVQGDLTVLGSAPRLENVRSFVVRRVSE
ncbi:hypothetical protein PV405_11570 [Streptomyces sp. ME02-6979-3A]|uniref:Uncharacterized protein n=1 Tax=Streptomyces silvae TaxID=2803812 RepID=A0ABU8A2G7_9ACTN|nr:MULTISPECIES: hypothetical protein [unclassified Streptomyces]MDX3325302.1 hypothetical protein [Streptomyces sp. ME02-6979-3A]